MSGREPGRLQPGAVDDRPRSGPPSPASRRPRSPSGGVCTSWSERESRVVAGRRWLTYVTTERWGWDDIFIVEVGTGAKIDLTPEASSFDFEPAWQPVCQPSPAGRSPTSCEAGSTTTSCAASAAGTPRRRRRPRPAATAVSTTTPSARATVSATSSVAVPVGTSSYADRVDLVGVDCERIRRR